MALLSWTSAISTEQSLFKTIKWKILKKSLNPLPFQDEETQLRFPLDHVCPYYRTTTSPQEQVRLVGNNPQPYLYCLLFLHLPTFKHLQMQCTAIQFNFFIIYFYIFCIFSKRNVILTFCIMNRVATYLPVPTAC